MIRVIINADDLGKSPEVNREIGNALAKGYITSATILANSLYWDDIHKIVDSNPQASFGVHLNLTEGMALSRSEVFKKYDIVDDSNMFTKRMLEILHSDHIPEDLSDAIFCEWDKQLDKIKNIENIHITHIDGHHHIHHYYVLSGVLSRLLSKYNITALRRRYTYPVTRSVCFATKLINIITKAPIYNFISKYCKDKSKYLNFILLSMEASLWYKQFEKFCLSDYFDSYEHFLTRLNYNISNDVIIELMCHPGSMKYNQEYALIQSMTLNSLLECKLVSYDAIK